MGTIGIIYIVLGVLYTIACCMDGPDLKPRWKRWLGAKLEAKANSLLPINYCDKGSCKYYLQWMPPHQKLPPIEVHTFNTNRIEHKVMISESQLMEARYQEDMARRHGMLLPKRMTVEGIIDEAKQLCVRKMLDSVMPYIEFDVRDGEWKPEIIVSGSIVVGKERR